MCCLTRVNIPLCIVQTQSCHLICSSNRLKSLYRQFSYTVLKEVIFMLKNNLPVDVNTFYAKGHCEISCEIQGDSQEAL